jgi:formate hydrogenlyase subunit 6/NADH:ubiquinone oxidoreductase subunit I
MLTAIAKLFAGLQYSLSYIWVRSADRKPAVEQYPDVISARTKEDFFPKSKGFLTNALNVCNGCGDCIRACSVKALEMDSRLMPDGAITVENFRIDLGRCYSCSVCVEICPVSSIKHTNEFELSVQNAKSMIIEITREQTELPAFVGKLRDLKKLRSYEARR